MTTKKTTPPDAGYDEVRDRQAAISRACSAAGRDCGAIPDIADVKRRARCRKSLKAFCTTYNSEAFSDPWCDDHFRVIARIEEAVTLGALYALAMPRASGKTTICRMAALWAISYAHCRYVFFIAANEDNACNAIKALKLNIAGLLLYGADFPEIAVPARSLGNLANRSAGQLCEGESTMIEWAGDQIVLPTVPPPANWPKAWPLRADGKVPTAGGVVRASGLTGDGIRGSLMTLTTGESVRPDLVLIDDPQTRESSASKTQNATREQLISADVLGMAGPGKKLAAVMPCTVITKGDLIDNILDRAKHPMWRGERTRMLRSMPKNMAAWDDYFEVHARCALREPPDYREANKLYKARRAELDEGAEASWPARKLVSEVSAIQHAMHLYHLDPRAFFSEYQNDPVAADLGALDELVAADVAARVNNAPRGTVPPDASRLTAMIDVGGKILYWAVCAWTEAFAGSVIDYGTYPPQTRSYFAADDARPSLADLPELAGFDETARVYAGLGHAAAHVLGRVYRRDQGGELKVEKCLVDAGWLPDTVHQFVRQSGHRAVLLPSKGYAIGAGSNPMNSWARKPGERTGDNWRVQPVTGGGRGTTCLFDPNHWKSFVAQRLTTPAGGAGAMMFFGSAAGEHRLFADHLTAEYRVRTTGRGRDVDEWKVRPERPDNHWLDCLVGCAVAASVLGVKWSAGAAAGEPATPPRPKVKRSMKDLYAKAKGVK